MLEFTIQKDYGKPDTRIILAGKNYLLGHVTDDIAFFETIYELLSEKN